MAGIAPRYVSLRNSKDAAILRALSDGDLRVDTDTGTVYRNGRPVGARSDGYLRVRLSGGYANNHRIVWLAAHGSIPGDKEIDHINRCRHDNRLSNLRAVTRRENQQNKDVRGERHGRAKITDEQTREVKRLAWLGVKHAAIAEQFGIARSRVSQIKHTPQHTHLEESTND